MTSTRALILAALFSLGCEPWEDPAVDGMDSDGEDEDDDEADAFRGCGRRPDAILDGWIDVGGTIREYSLDLPDDYDRDRAYPLVFAFHGLTESETTAAQRFRIVEEWDGQAIGIYPRKPDGALWDFTATGPDVAFFDELFEQATSELCIDPTLVFAAGFSAGGYFSNTLLCARPDIVRAAAIGGSGPPQTTCDVPKPIWAAHGINDEIVPFDEGVAMRDFWWNMNGCNPTWTPVADEPRCVEYDGCREPTVWCEYAMGHWWMDEWENPAMTAFLQRFVPVEEMPEPAPPG